MENTKKVKNIINSKQKHETKTNRENFKKVDT